MSDTKKNAGQAMLDFLKAKAKRSKTSLAKASATTEELATAAGIPVKQAYDRLWWMEQKVGALASSGTGKARVWRVRATPKPPKKSQEETVVTESTAAAE